MREFVYLSASKLDEFRGTQSKRWWPFPQTTLEVGVPFLKAAVNATTAEGRQPEGDLDNRLRDVTRHLEPLAVWYECETVRAGAWVTFEVLMNYVRVNEELVLFVDAHPSEQFRRRQVRASYRQVRLLLHGSTESLQRRAVHEMRQRGAMPKRAAQIKYKMSEGPYVFNLFADFAEAFDLPAAGAGAHSRATRKGWPPRDLTDQLWRIAKRLDDDCTPATAAWFAGYARVSAVVPARPDDPDPDRIVVASPLYVERVPAPVGAEYE